MKLLWYWRKATDRECETPSCSIFREKYKCKTVYEVTSEVHPDAKFACEKCGAYSDGEKWVSSCNNCGKEVEHGKLVGIFVPHVCGACMEKTVEEERAAGRVCRACGQVFSLCCC